MVPVVILIAVCLVSDTSDEIPPALFTSSTPKAARRLKEPNELRSLTLSDIKEAHVHLCSRE